MSKSKNVILIDFPKAEQWKFKEVLNEKTHMQWEEIELVSNQIRKNKAANVIRYLKYVFFPLKVFFSRKKYDNIIAWQQFYGLLYAFYCRLFHTKKRNKLIIMTFIYKPKNGVIGRIYYKFMNYIVQSKYIDSFICFSKNECEYYTNLFNVQEDKFKFCTLGIDDIKINNSKIANQKNIISCGRSNRDYNFLYNALKQTDYKLDIISDECKLESYKNITIYNNVGVQDFLEMLDKSYIVVIPLLDENISSGQLVILQAMQLGKPVICTKSNTVTDYIIDGENGFIIEKDEKKLIELIEKLYEDEELYNKISLKQKEIFEKSYSMGALGDQVASIINKI
jgi:glycosyltransferase involved in cell wall biosynthesis